MNRTHHRPHPSRRTLGFSLVELLVSMTLGLLLTSGVLTVFISNRTSSDLNAAIANLQEGARYALDTLATDVRNAGFIGCLGVQGGNSVIKADDAPTASLIASVATGSVVGDPWSPAPPPTFDTEDRGAIPGTHAVALQFGDPDTYLLREQMQDGGGIPAPGAAIKLVESIDGAVAGDLAVISNCEQADLFAISEIVGGGKNNLRHNASHNVNGALSTAYGDPRTIRQTSVMLFRSNVYYIADTGQENEDGDALLALYRQSLPYEDANPPTELVAGVENLRVLFGVRDGNGVRYFAPGDALLDFSRVESVRIGLLMVSRDAVAAQDDDRTYMLAGQAIPAAAAGAAADGTTHARDRRHRLAFNTTVKIRNRRAAP